MVLLLLGNPHMDLRRTPWYPGGHKALFSRRGRKDHVVEELGRPQEPTDHILDSYTGRETLNPKPLIFGVYNCILQLQASTLIQHSLPGQPHSVPAVQTHFTRTSGLPAAMCTARWESCVGSRVLGSQLSGLWLARNEAVDPYSNPHIANPL